MTNDDLIFYIEDKLDDGIPRETITARLANAGWHREDVEEGFLKVEEMQKKERSLNSVVAPSKTESTDPYRESPANLEEKPKPILPKSAPKTEVPKIWSPAQVARIDEVKKEEFIPTLNQKPSVNKIPINIKPIPTPTVPVPVTPSLFKSAIISSYPNDVATSAIIFNKSVGVSKWAIWLVIILAIGGISGGVIFAYNKGLIDLSFLKPKPVVTIQENVNIEVANNDAKNVAPIPVDECENFTKEDWLRSDFPEKCAEKLLTGEEIAIIYPLSETKIEAGAEFSFQIKYGHLVKSFKIVSGGLDHDYEYAVPQPDLSKGIANIKVKANYPPYNFGFNDVEVSVVGSTNIMKASQKLYFSTDAKPDDISNQQVSKTYTIKMADNPQTDKLSFRAIYNKYKSLGGFINVIPELEKNDIVELVPQINLNEKDIDFYYLKAKKPGKATLKVTFNGFTKSFPIVVK